MNNKTSIIAAMLSAIGGFSSSVFVEPTVTVGRKIKTYSKGGSKYATKGNRHRSLVERSNRRKAKRK